MTVYGAMPTTYLYKTLGLCVDHGPPGSKKRGINGHALGTIISFKNTHKSICQFKHVVS